MLLLSHLTPICLLIVAFINRSSKAHHHLVVVAGPNKAEFIRFHGDAEFGALYIDGPTCDATWHRDQPWCVIAQSNRLSLAFVKP